MKENDKNHLKLNERELYRYARHISLKEIGINGQKLLKSSSVLCIGSGGLGSPVLMYLAAAGIGRIGIVDFDVVELSNLQRQIIHGVSWIGKSKIDSAKASILEINPDCKVDIFNQIINKDNALKIIQQYDLVCDCTDNFPSRYLINDASVISNKPYIYGSIGGFEGHTTVFNLNCDSPNLRDLIPEPPDLDLIPSCAESGVIGVIPGIIGSIQATEVIKIITDIGNTLDGRLLIFNALSMKFKELNIPSTKKAKEINSLIEYEGFCFHEEATIKKISAKELLAIIEKEDILLIDVRTELEYKNNYIEKSKLFPLEEIENGTAINAIKQISNNKKIYVHCKSGKRSLKALMKLKDFGILGTNVEGGIDAINQEILNSNP